MAMFCLLLVGSRSSARPPGRRLCPLLERGKFPNPRPLRATYQFGWNDVVAANAEINFGKSDGQVAVSRHRRNHSASSARFGDSTCNIAPSRTRQRCARSRCIRSMRRGRKLSPPIWLSTPTASLALAVTTKRKSRPLRKTFNFPGLLDLHSALLLSAQPAAHRWRGLSFRGLSCD